MPRAARTGSGHPTLIDQPSGPTGLPRTLAPMRPRLAEEGFNSPDHFFELKWDGIRALVSNDGGGLRIIGRNGGGLTPPRPALRSLRLPHGRMPARRLLV